MSLIRCSVVLAGGSELVAGSLVVCVIAGAGRSNIVAVRLLVHSWGSKGSLVEVVSNWVAGGGNNSLLVHARGREAVLLDSTSGICDGLHLVVLLLLLVLGVDLKLKVACELALVLELYNLFNSVDLQKLSHSHGLGWTNAIIGWAFVAVHDWDLNWVVGGVEDDIEGLVPDGFLASLLDDVRLEDSASNLDHAVGVHLGEEVGVPGQLGAEDSESGSLFLVGVCLHVGYLGGFFGLFVL